MRYAAKVDKNQHEIVAALREINCNVLPLHAVGGGVPDLLWHAKNKKTQLHFIGLIEVKCADGKAQNKYRDERCLTPRQKEFHRKWGGFGVVIDIVWDSNEAVAAVTSRTGGNHEKMEY